MKKEGIIVRAYSKRTLAEEASFAYKNVNDMADIVHSAGLAQKTAKLKPLAVIKG